MILHFIKRDVTHHIKTTGPSVHACSRRLTPEQLKIALQEFNHMIDLGIVHPASSGWSSPLHMVPKKSGDWGLQGNTTTPDHYLIPHIQDFTSTIHGATIFSKINLVQAYHQIPVEPADVQKTAVTTQFGLFEFLRMPFGLRNSTQIFQRFIRVFEDKMQAICEFPLPHSQQKLWEFLGLIKSVSPKRCSYAENAQ